MSTVPCAVLNTFTSHDKTKAQGLKGLDYVLNPVFRSIDPQHLLGFVGVEGALAGTRFPPGLAPAADLFR
jgi:hypothetical protein